MAAARLRRAELAISPLQQGNPLPASGTVACLSVFCCSAKPAVVPKLGARPVVHAAAGQGSSTVLDTSSVVANSFCPHPDAVKRRAEAEAMRKRREQEREKARQLAQAQETAGSGWWQASCPDNMVAVTSVASYAQLVNEMMASKQLLVVKYFTEDCYNCRSLHPKLKQIAENNPDVVFAKINGSRAEMQGVFKANNIVSVPMFQFVKDGQVKSQFSVSLNPEKLAMLRAEIAAHKDRQLADSDTSAYTKLEN